MDSSADCWSRARGIREPEQRGGGIAFVQQMHAVGDVETHEALAVSSASRVSRRPVGISERRVRARGGFVSPAHQPSAMTAASAVNERPGALHEAQLPASLRWRRTERAALEQREVGVHFLGGLVALVAVRGAGFEQDGVELEQGGGVRCFGDLRVGFGKSLRSLPHAGFVQDLAQAVEVGLRRVRAFRRMKPSVPTNERASASS